MLARFFASRCQRERAGADCHEGAGRDHVHTVGLYPCPRLDLIDRHPGCFGKDFRQQAVMAGIEMLNQYEGHSGINRQRMKEFLVGFQTACRSPNSDHGERAGSPCRSIFLQRGSGFRYAAFHRRLAPACLGALAAREVSEPRWGRLSGPSKYFPKRNL